MENSSDKDKSMNMGSRGITWPMAEMEIHHHHEKMKGDSEMKSMNEEQKKQMLHMHLWQPHMSVIHLLVP